MVQEASWNTGVSDPPCGALSKVGGAEARVGHHETLLETGPHTRQVNTGRTGGRACFVHRKLRWPLAPSEPRPSSHRRSCVESGSLRAQPVRARLPTPCAPCSAEVQLQPSRFAGSCQLRGHSGFGDSPLPASG